MRGRTSEVYLQGSYRNDTNVRGDSDVDVVAQVNEVFYHDISRLDATQQRAYESQRTTATYSWRQFRLDVLAALQTRFGHANVHERNKCITVARSEGTLTADVVVAAQYRSYRRFVSTFNEAHHTGMTFWTLRENRQIVNWPKQHYDNGVIKNGTPRTSGRYKPTVRMFKNARSAAVGRGLLAETDTPSFFVECLLYNVPEDRFASTQAQTYFNIIEWLHGRDMTRFVCGNELVYLFGSGSEQWQLDAGRRTVNALIRLWNEW